MNPSSMAIGRNASAMRKPRTHTHVKSTYPETLHRRRQTKKHPMSKKQRPPLYNKQQAPPFKPTRILKRGETLVPPSICIESFNREERDDVSVLSSDSDCRDVASDFHTSSFIPHKQVAGGPPTCRIQVLDDRHAMGEMPSWFHVSFDDDNTGDFVELHGTKILDFLSAMLEYDDSWVFGVQHNLTGVVTLLESHEVVDALRFLLSWTTTGISHGNPPRKPWQQQWDFFEEDNHVPAP